MIDLTDPRTVWDKRRSIMIIDVREPFQYRDGTIEGAVNMSLASLVSGDVELDPWRPVVVVCHDGDEAETAALMLQVKGYMAYALAGGMEAWERTSMPMVSPAEVDAQEVGGAA